MSNQDVVKFNIDLNDNEVFGESDSMIQLDSPTSPNRLLVEIFHLQKDSSESNENDWIWKEKGRLIKFEEVVEDGERWSKPHVSSLNMESVNDLKEIFPPILIHGLEANDYKDFVEKVISIINIGKDFSFNQLKELGQLLYSKRDHLKGVYKKQNSSEQSAPALPQKKVENVFSTNFNNRPSSVSEFLCKLDDQKNSQVFKPNKKISRHLPQNCESANIHVGTVDFLEEPLFVWLRLKESKLLSEMLTEVFIPMRFFVLLIGPGGFYNYEKIGSVIGAMLSDDYFRPTAYMANDINDIREGFDSFLECTTLLPPGQWDCNKRIEPPEKLPPVALRRNHSRSFSKDKEAILYKDSSDPHADISLKRSGRLFGGLIEDVKRKYHHYLSDFKDVLHPQCLASIVFIYIACLSPIITFGGLQGLATDNYLSAMEGIVSGCICGVIFSLLSGQPLLVLGATGPMLVFEMILYKFSILFGWYFLSVRVWVGIWSCIYMLIIVAFDLSSFVVYITRFTEEAFATLICVIFIQQALLKLFSINDEFAVNSYAGDVNRSLCQCFLHPNVTNYNNLNVTITTTMPTAIDYENDGVKLLPDFFSNKYQCEKIGGIAIGEGCNYVPDVFFFSILLFMVTFVTAYSLKMFQNSPFFPQRVRQIISDFAVAIAVILAVLLDWYYNLPTPKLNVPSELKPTNSERSSWLVPFFRHEPWWMALVSAIPALLCTILICLDQQITAVIINRVENKLKKGFGYHLDLFILAFLILICSILGLPWFVAATVRSMTHVNSLKVQSEGAMPGEKPTFHGVRENRVTMLAVSILIGLSVYLSSLFQLIPMPVLYGVFMFMGVSALKGLQLVDRCLLIFMPQKYQPEYNYLKKVKTWKVHLFTGIQIACLSVLWAIKAIKVTSIGFPIMILLICVVRKFLECIFSKHELKVLDDILPQSESKKKRGKRGSFKKLIKSDEQNSKV